jgi:hypothetical protein
MRVLGLSDEEVPGYLKYCMTIQNKRELLVSLFPVKGPPISGVMEPLAGAIDTVFLGWYRL